MSDDAAQKHFADGIVEDLTTRLQALPGLKVMSRQSASAYQGRQVDARTISRELGCQYVVEGSVRKIDDRMRVTAQLIDAPRDEHVWAERYDRRLEDAFALQDEICDQIVAAIHARVAPSASVDERTPDASIPADNSKAGEIPRSTRRNRETTARQLVDGAGCSGARGTRGCPDLDAAAAQQGALGARGGAAAARSADRKGRLPAAFDLAPGSSRSSRTTRG